MLSSVVRYVGRHHVGLIALFMAMGGTAYAAAALPVNSVGTRQLRSRAVTLAKINPGARKALRGRTGAMGPTGPSDGYYTASPVSITGFADEGASVKVPAGNYIATGGCTASQGNQTGQSTSSLTFGAADAVLSATGTAGEPGTFSSTASVPNEGYEGTGFDGTTVQAGAASLSNSGAFALPNGGTITETCRDDQTPPAGGIGGGSTVTHMDFSGYYLTAIKVATLNGN